MSDLASPQSTQPFMSFGTVKDPSKMLGASYNLCALAVKFHMQKKATGEDIQKTADSHRSYEIANYRPKAVMQCTPSPLCVDVSNAQAA